MGWPTLSGESRSAADTAVRYASVSKHFMAALVLSEGTLPLDDFLGAHLKLPPALGGVVTLGRALDMTGGLPDALETFRLLGVPSSATLGRAALFDFVRRIDALDGYKNPHQVPRLLKSPSTPASTPRPTRTRSPTSSAT